MPNSDSAVCHGQTNRDRRTRRPSGAGWSSWLVADGPRKNRLGSSTLSRRRSATGSSRPTGMRVGARTD